LTNIKRISRLYNMQMHKEVKKQHDTTSKDNEKPFSAACIVSLFDDYLPRTYSPIVIARLKSKNLYDKKYNTNYIRKVRDGHIKNPIVFSVLISIAGEQKTNMDNLRTTAKKVLAN